MYYYKEKEYKIKDAGQRGAILKLVYCQRGNYKDYIVAPKNIGGISHTNKVVRLTSQNEAIQANVMYLASKFSKADTQREQRRAKR